MRASYILLSCLLVASCLWTSCSSPRETLHLNVSLRNDTTIPLDWVKLQWDGPFVPGGILSPGTEKTSVGVLAPKSDFATISFVEDSSRKPHKITLDVSPLKALHAGKYDAVIAITALDRASLSVSAEPTAP